MIINEQGDVFQCDCGFSWRRGHSGSHDCAKGLRSHRDELLAAMETVKQQRDELVVATKVLLVVLNKYASTTSNVEVVTSADEEIAAAYRQARKAISSVEGGAS